MSADQEHIEVEGTVCMVLPGTMFRVKLDNQHEVLAHISGKMRKHWVRLSVGDRVRIEMSPYDLTKARITYASRTSPITGSSLNVRYSVFSLPALYQSGSSSSSSGARSAPHPPFIPFTRSHSSRAPAGISFTKREGRCS